MIPADIQEACLEAIMATAVSEAKSEKAKPTLYAAFAAVGVSRDQLTAYLGKPASELTPEEIVGLRQLLTSLEEGVRWDDIMDMKAESERTPRIKMEAIEDEDAAT
jgi:hypothetical protein